MEPFTLSPHPAESAALDALLARVERERDANEAALLDRGALLLRGWQIESAAAFGELVAMLAGRTALLAYRGGASPRRALEGGTRPVYNSTEYPAHIELPLHNELSYTADYPERVYFLCLEAPEAGGETTLGDSRRILAAMPAPVRRALEKGVRYIRNLPSGRGTGYSWQDAFECDDALEVERRSAAMGAEYEWTGGGWLRLTQERPATHVHPETGAHVWFNQADGFHPSALDDASRAELLRLYGDEDRFRLGVRYGDGTPIEAETLAAIRAVLRTHAVPHIWRPGDVLVLDNILTAHGRRPFTGPRRIAAAMS
ncbi:MAG TPA: TauD/TfdA family dioxygenase [Allosphingosinicella sp.]|nr:TauD/TfdA family dioxygenase [Allosphingosinicella sp.]